MSVSGYSSSRGWPTPDANTSTYSNGYRGHENIREAAANWATPRATDGDKGVRTPQGAAKEQLRRKNGQDLPTLVLSTQWPTPNVPNGGRYLAPEYVEAKGATPNGKRQVGLEMATAYWPSPTARVHKGGGNAVTRKDGKSRMDMLDWRAEAFSRQGQTMSDGPPSSIAGHFSRPRLNAAFAAWLMGWPWFWTTPAVTSSAQPAMESWRSQQRAHMCSLLGERES